MINVNGLTFTYPKAKKETLHGLNFEIEKGEIFGFLGPSGAGKSTTQNILTGLLKNFRGQVEIMGRNVLDWGQDIYEKIGISFEMPNHYLKLSALENLEHFGSLYQGQIHTPLEVLEWVDLKEDANKKVEAFSKGMKIRLNVARSILHKPDLLFLDEPTNGLDPVNARRIKDLILELRSQGTTVFVTTHNMSVADELCDRVAFITDGQINLIDAPSTLKKQFGKRQVKVEYLNTEQEIQYQEFPLDGLLDNQDFISLMRSGQKVETLHTQETSLEEIFIQVTGKELDL